MTRTRVTVAGHEPTLLVPLDEWVRPVVALPDGTEPVISDGFKPRKAAKSRFHPGVDWCFKNRRAMRPMLPHNTKWFHCPADALVVACGRGKVYKASHTERGWRVVIDHGKTPWGPLCSYYTHLANLRPGIVVGAEVHAGDILGNVGDDPANPHDVRHLHFELWVCVPPGTDRLDWVVDPAPIVADWPVVYVGA